MLSDPAGMLGDPAGMNVKGARAWGACAGLSAEEAAASPFIASMGIYVFKKDLMLQLLREQAKSNDFGGEIIPSAAGDKRVMAYLFNDYWEDIGTITSFFEANLGLAAQARARPLLHLHPPPLLLVDPPLSARLLRPLPALGCGKMWSSLKPIHLL